MDFLRNIPFINWQTLNLTRQWGLEATLIVGVAYAYLKTIGRNDLTKAIRWGILAGVIASVPLTPVFDITPNQMVLQAYLLELAGLFALIAAVLMWPTSRSLFANGRTETSGITRAAVLVFAYTTFLIARRGMQIGAIVEWVVFEQKSMVLLNGAIVGTLIAALSGFAWVYIGPKLKRETLFEATAIFHVLFVATVVLWGLHYFSEAHMLPYSEPFHTATEEVSPDGFYGKRFPFLFGLIPLFWVMVRAVVGRRETQPQAVKASRA